MQGSFEVHLAVTCEGSSAATLLAGETALSKQHVKRVMQQGAVWLESGGHVRRLRRGSRLLNPGEVLHLYYDASVLSNLPPEARLIADEGAYSVWYKPYGMLSQGSKWGDHCTITRWAEQHLTPERPAFTVHRLDRAASGLILVAHQKKAAASLSQLFQNRALEKRYRLVVEGHYLSSGDGVTVRDEIDGKAACTHIHYLAYDNRRDASLLEVTIETGRKHQIRRHLASLGFPIVGDRLYGTAEGSADVDLQLTACLLRFICPITQQQRDYKLPEYLLPIL